MSTMQTCGRNPDADRGRTPVIAIVGPTASGKSDVADIVASRLGTSVLSADAMQVYRGMDVGTAKTPADRRRAPLELVDIVDPDEEYSAALFQRDARRSIESLYRAGKTPVICGGTGLYVRAALDDMRFPKGEIGSAARSRYHDLCDTLGAEGLHDLLAQRDPDSAKLIHPNNVRRVVRALEMLDEGTSYAEQNRGFSTPNAFYPALYFGLRRSREALYDRINRRVDHMLENGLLEEVDRLAEKGFSGTLTARQAIGYKELLAYRAGSCTFGEAVDLIKLRSRRYAKRQLSWFGRDSRIEWIDMDGCDAGDAAATIVSRFERAQHRASEETDA